MRALNTIVATLLIPACVSLKPPIPSSALLEVATQSARAAAHIIRSATPTLKTTKANAKDLLTTTDPACEAAIISVIRSRFPDHHVLGEESVAPGAAASAEALSSALDQHEFVWIVDPLDGTTNFAKGLPICAPSVAVAYQGVVVAGCIIDPFLDVVYTAAKGEGFRVSNSPPVLAPKCSKLSEAVVAMGTPPADVSAEMSAKGYPLFSKRSLSVRMLGSAALMLAHVATGSLQAYWEYDLSSWDVAAGGLMVEEAGGEMGWSAKGFDVRERRICATVGGGLWGEVRETLMEAGVME